MQMTPPSSGRLFSTIKSGNITSRVIFNINNIENRWIRPEVHFRKEGTINFRARTLESRK